MSKMKNSDKKLKSELVKLKAENKQLSKRLKANDNAWKKKLAEAISAAESAIQAAYNQGHEDSSAIYEQKAKEKAKMIAEVEAVFNKKYKKLSSKTKPVQMKKQSAILAKRKSRGKKKIKLEEPVKDIKSTKVMDKKRKVQKKRKPVAPVVIMEKQQNTQPSAPSQQPPVQETPAQPYKSEFDF